MSGRTKGFGKLALLLALSLGTPPLAAAPGAQTSAHGAEPPASVRADARRLVLEGDQLYAQQSYEEALARYSEAYRAMHVPTVGIEVVKAREALGRIVEAAQTAREVAALPRQQHEPAVFGEARLRAAQDARRLNALTPALLFEVAPRGVLFSVLIDGISPSGPSPFELNPGPHHVQVVADGYQSVELDVTLQQADRQTLTVTLFPLAPEVAPAATAVSAPVPAVVAPPAPRFRRDPGAQRSSSARTLGWLGIGVAGMGVAAGTFAGISAFQKKPDCPGGVCRPSQKQDLDSSRQMGQIADVSFGVAIVAGALGVWALLASSGDEGESAAAPAPLQARAARAGGIRVRAIDVAAERAEGALRLRLSGSF